MAIHRFCQSSGNVQSYPQIKVTFYIELIHSIRIYPLDNPVFVKLVPGFEQLIFLLLRTCSMHIIFFIELICWIRI